MGLKLEGKRLLIKADNPKNITEGGIYLPDQSVEERNIGTVILIGDEVDKKFDGAKVMIQKHGSQRMVYEEEPHLLVFQPDIIGILT